MVETILEMSRIHNSGHCGTLRMWTNKNLGNATSHIKKTLFHYSFNQFVKCQEEIIIISRITKEYIFLNHFSTLLII